MMSVFKHLRNFFCVIITITLLISCKAVKTTQIDSSPTDEVFTSTNIEEVAILLKQGETKVEVNFKGNIIIESGDSIENLKRDPQIVLELIERLERLGEDYSVNHLNADDIAEKIAQEDMVYFANLGADKYLASLSEADNEIASRIPTMLYEIDAFLRDSQANP